MLAAEALPSLVESWVGSGGRAAPYVSMRCSCTAKLQQSKETVESYHLLETECTAVGWKSTVAVKDAVPLTFCAYGHAHLLI
jgi:hypothetical protein